jgi:hypothetical protein
VADHHQHLSAAWRAALPGALCRRHLLLLLLLHRGAVQFGRDGRESEAPWRLHSRHSPGKATEQYFDYLLNRITVIGAAYLVVICLIPEIALSQAGIPFYLAAPAC